MDKTLTGDAKADQQLTHGVEVIHGMMDSVVMAGCISDGMKKIADRAVAAGMLILSTTISTNTTALNGRMCLTVTVICHWASRDALEQQQRQAALMGQNGPRRMQ